MKKSSAAIGIMLSLGFAMPATAAGLYPKADPGTLQGKVLFGYQGWFDCPASGGGQWTHWSRGEPNAGSLSVDMYPDLSEIPLEHLCQAPALSLGGRPAVFYSARTPAVVDAHFRWMEEYGLDGVLVQRFLIEAGWKRGNGEVVLKNIMAAAAAHGRTFAIEYDISSANDNDYINPIRGDWMYLVDELKVTSHPNYLRHGGKPVVGVWGAGLTDRIPSDPARFKTDLIDWFKNGPAQYRAVYMGGTPARWRTLNVDSRGGAGWEAAYKAMDVIQPWTVDRYKDTTGAKAWALDMVAPDVARTNANGGLYMPVAFPGFSCKNLGLCAANQVPRHGGKFLWAQAYGAKAAGASMLKIAMFDETDEGSAMFKMAARRDQAPDQGFWLPLDADGFDLPSDWYLRLGREVTRMFHGERPATEAMPLDPRFPASSIGAVPASGPGLAWRRTPEGLAFTVAARSIVEIHAASGKRIAISIASGGSAFWDLRDDAGRKAAPGVYLARMLGGSGSSCVFALP